MTERPVTVDLSMWEAMAVLRATTTNKHRAQNADADGIADWYNTAGIRVRDALDEALEDGWVPEVDDA